MSQQLDYLAEQWDAENAYQAGADLSFAPTGGGFMLEPSLLTAGASILGSALKGGSSGGPSRADGRLDNDQMFDFSGWNVTTSGGGAITSDRQQLPAIGGNWQTLAFIAVGGLVLWKILNKKPK